MSFIHLDQVFQDNSGDTIATSISKILHNEYGASGAALKLISRKTNVAERTVKNWYEGNNTPSLGHFVRLVRASPEMLVLFLLLCDYSDIAKAFILKNQQVQRPKSNQKIVCYSIIFDTDHSDIDVDSWSKLHQRQLWFYSEVDLGNKPNAKTLSEFWSVSPSTAKRDIAFLTHLRLIGFVGSRRSGFYVSRQPVIN